MPPISKSLTVLPPFRGRIERVVVGCALEDDLVPLLGDGAEGSVCIHYSEATDGKKKHMAGNGGDGGGVRGKAEEQLYSVDGWMSKDAMV